jgi:hypothetical protein
LFIRSDRRPKIVEHYYLWLVRRASILAAGFGDFRSGCGLRSRRRAGVCRVWRFVSVAPAWLWAVDGVRRR